LTFDARQLNFTPRFRNNFTPRSTFNRKTNSALTAYASRLSASYPSSIQDNKHSK